MIRTAICDKDAQERIRLRDAIERYARSSNINNVEVMQFTDIASFSETAARMRPGFFDPCFCRIYGDSDEEAIEEVRKLHADNPDMHLVILSDDKSQAIYSYDLDAGFLHLSNGYDDFVRVVSGPFDDIVRATRGEVATVKSRNGVESMLLSDIQFVESSKRGSIIHLPLGKHVATRGTLQTLFDSLTAVDVPSEGAAAEGARASETRGGRFVRAGSSFIVNLDNVRSAGEGSLIFADGETIIVPIRKRKAVLDALDSYQTRR